MLFPEGPICYVPPARAVADTVRGLRDLGDVRAVVADGVQRGSVQVWQLAEELSLGSVRGSARLRRVLHVYRHAPLTLLEGACSALRKKMSAPLTTGIGQRIAILFRPNDIQLVSSLLTDECGPSLTKYPELLERIRFAVLKLSHGDLNALQQAIALKPDYAEAYYNLAGIFAHQGSKKEAKKNFERSTKIDKNFADGYNNLAVAYYYEKKYNKAIKLYTKAIDLRQDATLPQQVEQIVGEPVVDSAVDCVGFEAHGHGMRDGATTDSIRGSEGCH